MAEQMIRARTHVVVCVALVALTVLTVGLSFVHVPPTWHVAIGLLIAACKASLVVLIFMHVLVSPRIVWTVLIAVGFWLGLLMVLTLTDYLTRGMIPIAPGH